MANGVIIPMEDVAYNVATERLREGGGIGREMVKGEEAVEMVRQRVVGGVQQRVGDDDARPSRIASTADIVSLGGGKGDGKARRTGNGNSNAPACVYFLNGVCRYGDACRHRHAIDEHGDARGRGNGRGKGRGKGRGRGKGKAKGDGATLPGEARGTS